jgi:deoxyadenosine/deoxycytidine kinase
MRVCVEGNIGSGKSACVQYLGEALAGEVSVFPEPLDQWGDLLSKFYENADEWAFPFSLKVLLGFQEPRRHETCIVERSPLACREVFGQLLYKDNTLNCHEWDLFKEYHDVLGWEPDAILYIDTPPHVCMDRIQSRGRACEAGISETYLKRIEFQYGIMLRFTTVPVVRVDGTLPPAELQARVLEEVRRILTTGAM